MNPSTSQRRLTGIPIFTICVWVQDLLPHIDIGHGSLWSIRPFASFLVRKLLASPCCFLIVEPALGRQLAERFGVLESAREVRGAGRVAREAQKKVPVLWQGWRAFVNIVGYMVDVAGNVSFVAVFECNKPCSAIAYTRSIQQ